MTWFVQLLVRSLESLLLLSDKVKIYFAKPNEVTFMWDISVGIHKPRMIRKLVRIGIGAFDKLPSRQRPDVFSIAFELRWEPLEKLAR